MRIIFYAVLFLFRLLYQLINSELQNKFYIYRYRNKKQRSTMKLKVKQAYEMA